MPRSEKVDLSKLSLRRAHKIDGISLRVQGIIQRINDFRKMLNTRLFRMAVKVYNNMCVEIDYIHTGI